MTLDDPIKTLSRLTPRQENALEKLGLETIGDLLYYFPTRYGETAEVKYIKDLAPGESVSIFGKISGLKTLKAFHKKIPMAEGMVEDTTGKIKVVWFNQPYIAKLLSDGALVRVDGKTALRKGALYLSNPEIEKIPDIPAVGGTSLFGESERSYAYPVYSESKGITSRWFYHAITKILRSGILENIADPLPQAILEKYNLPSLKTALVWIHTPLEPSHSAVARKRFAFEEVLLIQLQKQQERKEYRKKKSFKIFKPEHEIESFLERLPFKATNAQRKAIYDIQRDFERDFPMSRLLEGDVGSGKTAVAAATVYSVVTTAPKDRSFASLQVAYMAPTEILAEQHFQSFIKYFEYLNISVALITSSGCKKFPSKLNPREATNISRAQLLKWVESGDIPILIGTHALIQKSVKFKNLAYIIIDEQHRFGTAQRQKLRRKDDDYLPHLLSMTATPIPRTLALTIYGDLDLTLLDEMPAGRKPVITETIVPRERQRVYQHMRQELASGKQAYVICPRIDAPDPADSMALNVKSVTEESKRLKKEIFPEFSIDMLHSKMKPAEKDRVMEDFKNGETKILVATSVVEVGVNVPNATMIVIEGAERFGLAQLHQLRGRVIRSADQAYCYIFADTVSAKTLDRLKALSTAKNGFELAEFDLAGRGAGELYGRKQWGISDIGMEAIKNLKMVEAARTEARFLLEADPELKRHSLLRERAGKQAAIHFE